MRLALHRFALVMVLILSIHFTTRAQLTGISINDNGIKADTSAILDVNVNSLSTKRGFLLPRVTATQRDAIYQPAKGLMVYVTTVDSLEINTGTTLAPVWSPLSTGSSGWLTYGNTGIGGSNFLGSINNASVRIRTNNLERVIIDSIGNVGIGTNIFNSTGNPEKLLVDMGSTTSYNVIAARGTVNSYLQLNVQNRSAGNAASSDVVATSNNGDETNNYIDLGINGSGYNGGFLGGANDAYLYNVGQDFYIANATANKRLGLLTSGGTVGDASTGGNERLTIDPNGLVGINNISPSATLHVVNQPGYNTLQLTGLAAGVSGDNVLTINSSGVVRYVPSSTFSTTTTHTLSSLVNTITSTVNGVSATAPAVNSVSNTSNANTLLTTVNGVAGATVPIVNSISNTSSGNTLLTTVNGVAGATVPIINTNALSLSGSSLTSTINGLGSTPLDISPAVRANAWALLGNSGTTAGTNFVGTTDAVDFVTKTNNTERVRVTSGGNVGIGTTAPTNALHVVAGSNPLLLSGVQSGAIADSLLSINSSGVVRYLNANRFVTTGSDWLTSGNTGTTASTSAIGTTANNNFIGTTDAKDWVAATSGYERLRIASAGNIGIQTTPGSTNLLDITSSTATNAFNVTTGNVVNITGNALTSGNALNVNSTGTITGSLATLTGNSATTGNIMTLSGTGLTSGSVISATAGTTTGDALKLTSNGVTTGNGVNVSANGLTTGNGLSIASTSTAGGASGSSYLVNLARSGANTNASHTAYGIKSAITNTGTTSTNVAGYFSASGATNNYPLQLVGVPGGAITDSILSINSAGVVRYLNTNRFVTTGTDWLTSGNTGTTASTSAIGTTANNNFIGTTDAKDWVAATSGYERLRIASAGNIGIQTTPGSTNLLDITSSTATNAFNVTTGNVVNITGNALTSGNALNVNSTGTITGSLATLTGNSATTGNIMTLSGTGLTSGSVISATAGTTTGDAVKLTSNGVTTGNGVNLTANGLTTGSGINVSSTGTIVSGGELLNLTGNSATTGNIATLSGTGLTSGSVIDATAGTTTGDAVKLTSNGVTTGNGINVSANGLTTGNGLSIASTSTAGGASGSSYLVNLARSGANTNASHTAYGIKSAITNTGTTSTNVAGYFSASGATNNYPLQLVGVPGGAIADSLLSINSSGVVRYSPYSASAFKSYANVL